MLENPLCLNFLYGLRMNSLMICENTRFIDERFLVCVIITLIYDKIFLHLDLQFHLTTMPVFHVLKTKLAILEVAKKNWLLVSDMAAVSCKPVKRYSVNKASFGIC